MAALHKYRYPVLFSLVGLLGSVSAHAVELTVQIGAFGDRPKAAFAEQAAQHGELLVLRGDDGITRVSVGRYDNKAAAREALQRLQIAGYPDAYIANINGRGTAIAAPDLAGSAPGASSTQTASLQRASRVPTTPEGRPIVAPKRTDADGSTSQAGRFRLRTHDTQSGQTSDVQLADSPVSPSGNSTVVAGLGANDIPRHLREKLVYLDGVPHIKEGEDFIPLTDAIDGE